MDASLWFIHAISCYLEYTRDFLFLSDIWETINNIIEYYLKGTYFEIGMDFDYLIRQGPQLTWMDGKIGRLAIAPRVGKACEINALWYNALKTASNLGALLGKILPRMRISQTRLLRILRMFSGIRKPG